MYYIMYWGIYQDTLEAIYHQTSPNLTDKLIFCIFGKKAVSFLRKTFYFSNSATRFFNNLISLYLLNFIILNYSC